MILGLRRQERGDDGAGLLLGRSLGEILEEIHQPLPPDGVVTDLAPGVHQHFINEDQGGEVLLGGDCQQLAQQVLRGCGLTLCILPLSVKEPKPVRSGDLVRQHAPRVAEPAFLAVRAGDLHSFLDIELVERHGDNPRPRWRHADVLAELVNGGEIGQRGGVTDQMK